MCMVFFECALFSFQKQKNKTTTSKISNLCCVCVYSTVLFHKLDAVWASLTGSGAAKPSCFQFSLFSSSHTSVCSFSQTGTFAVYSSHTYASQDHLSLCLTHTHTHITHHQFHLHKRLHSPGTEAADPQHWVPIFFLSCQHTHTHSPLLALH